MVEEAILYHETIPFFLISVYSFIVEYFTHRLLKYFSRRSQVLDQSVESFVLLLCLFPVEDMESPILDRAGRQHVSPLGLSRREIDSRLCFLSDRSDRVIEYSLDPWLRDLCKILFYLRLWEAIFDSTQKVGHSVICSPLIF